MASPFVAGIIMFGGNFAPRGWAFCDGQTLPIASNTALFSILGTTYGGDGRTTLGLPELRGRVAMHAGTGPGLSNRTLGERGGTQTNTLNANNLPAHNHPFNVPCHTAVGNTDAAVSGYPAMTAEDNYHSGTDDSMGAGTTGNNSGSAQSVNNLQPYTVVNFIIALVGTFPSRS